MISVCLCVCVSVWEIDAETTHSCNHELHSRQSHFALFMILWAQPNYPAPQKPNHQPRCFRCHPPLSISLTPTLSLSPPLCEIFHINSLFKNVTRNSKVCQFVWRPFAVACWQVAGKQYQPHTTHTHTRVVSTSCSQSLCPSVRPYLSSKGKNEARVVLTQCVMYYTGIWLFIPWIYTCLHARSACTDTPSAPFCPFYSTPWHSSLNK